MLKSWHFLLANSIAFANILVMNDAAQAIKTSAVLERVLISQRQANLTAQITPALQKDDVQPTDWAFQALQSLVEHYGCEGYPNAAFPRNKAITRDKFSVALNACLNRINELLATPVTTYSVKKEDLINIQKLQQAFKIEVAKLWLHDGLLESTPSLANNQSSTVTQPVADNLKEPNSSKLKETEKQVTENSNAHFQSTIIWQTKNEISASYSSANSLVLSAQQGFTFSATAFLGIRLWQGGVFYLNPETSSARTINNENLTGLGGLSNGENQKGGSVIPTFYIARALLRQSWNLGEDKEFVSSGANQLAEEVSKKRLVFTLGKLAVTDLFYSHDPRTQFFNWSFITHGAYDYSSDARGYTIGAALEYYDHDWTLRIARLAQPSESNGPQLDLNLLDHYGDQLEIEHDHMIGNQSGKVRFLLFRNQAIMGAFQDALNVWRANGKLGIPAVADVRKLQAKFGIGISFEQQLGTGVGAFLQGSWADGNTETFEFAEIERQIAGGLLIQGTSWDRPKDILGIGVAINWLGSAHIEYLANGGLGAFIGDGQLNYRPEQIFEAFYNWNVDATMTFGFDAQYILNPAYNADRGPVTFFGLRLHTEF